MGERLSKIMVIKRGILTLAGYILIGQLTTRENFKSCSFEIGEWDLFYPDLGLDLEIIFYIQ